MDPDRRLAGIIERDHRVVIAAVAFSPVLRALVGVKRSDVPRTDAEDVLHCGTVARIMPRNPIAIPQSRETQWRPLPLAKRGGQPMRAFFLEITAKLIIRSDTDPDDLPADIYSHLAEFIPNDEDIIDIEVQAVPLPPDLCGSPPH